MSKTFRPGEDRAGNLVSALLDTAHAYAEYGRQRQQRLEEAAEQLAGREFLLNGMLIGDTRGKSDMSKPDWNVWPADNLHVENAQLSVATKTASVPVAEMPCLHIVANPVGTEDLVTAFIATTGVTAVLLAEQSTSQEQ